MSIAQQIATPAPRTGARKLRAPLQPAPAPRRGMAMLQIAGLVTITSICAAVMAGAVVIGMLMLVTSLGG